MYFFLKNSYLLVIVLIFYTCHSSKEYTTKPTKSLKNPDSDLLEANMIAYHLNDSITQLYLEIKNENLLYKRPDTTKAFYTALKIVYKLMPEPNSRLINDSGTFFLKDRAEGEYISLKSIYSQVKLKAQKGFNQYLELEIFDLNRRIRYVQGLIIHKQSKYSAQNYLITKNDSVVFTTNFTKNEELIVHFSNSQVTRVVVSCFFKEFGAALPPFSSKEIVEPLFTADSTFLIALNTNQFKITMPEKGFYHIKTGDDDYEGLNLFTYDENFPGLADSDEMISCTRYIMTKEEYEDCKSSSNQKACIDNFWLNIAGSHERGRELLKRYYGRVKEANKNYSSFTQGWKTDRGMVYTVLGPPLNIYRSKKDEVWVYGNEANPNSLRLIFNKESNPYSDNYFVLERSQFYKDAWYAAVEQWRQGRIYSETGK